MRPGDRLVSYLTGLMKFGGIATVTSECLEGHAPIVVAKKPGEDCPFRRVRAQPEVILEPCRYSDVEEMAPRMQYTKNWPPRQRRAAFQGDLHQIPEADCQLILGEMHKAAPARA
jgi:hypothetical protein